MTSPSLPGPAYLDEPVAFELMKLLVQVAFSDYALEPSERESILLVADALLPSDDKLAAVEAWLDGKEQLPAPDLGVLRAHKSEVLLEAKRVIQADGVVEVDEQAMFAEIKRLLS